MRRRAMTVRRADHLVRGWSRVGAFAALAGIAAPGLAQTPSTPVAPAPIAAAPQAVAPGMPDPPSSPAVRVGQFFAFPFGGASQQFGDPQDPAWRFGASAGLSVRATDNVNSGRSGSREGDVVTTASGSFSAVGNGPRLGGALFYTPSYSYFANGTADDRWRHQFAGNLVATVVPDRFFIDMRGSANYLPISGGFIDGNTLTAGQDNTAQTAAFTVSPYVQQRFGTLASAIAGYTYTYSRIDGTTQALAPGQLPFFQEGESWSHTGFGALRTGEDFGRLAAEGSVSATTFGGTGAIDGSHRYIYLLSTRYSVLRGVAVLLEGGYEDSEYKGTPGYRVDEAIWGFGLRWDPDPDTTITVRYQRRFGFDSPAVDARWQVAPRTTIFGRYAETVASNTLDQSNLLSETRVNEFGQFVDTTTGATRPETSGGLLTSQSGLFRRRRGDASISQTFLRDVVTLRVSYEERRPLSADPGTTQFEQESRSVGLSWSRAVDPLTVLTVSGSVGLVDTPSLGTDDPSYFFTAGLRRQLSPTLSASIAYEFTNRDTSLNSTNPTLGVNDDPQNAIIATIRKSF
jgi:uncharacterized protein (PEP-CTERM system associated)